MNEPSGPLGYSMYNGLPLLRSFVNTEFFGNFSNYRIRNSVIPFYAQRCEKGFDSLRITIQCVFSAALMPCYDAKYLCYMVFVPKALHRSALGHFVLALFL